MAEDVLVWDGQNWESLVGPKGDPGPSAVSSDPNNLSTIGSDGLITVDQATLDDIYVNVTGDTMTGPLVIGSHSAAVGYKLRLDGNSSPNITNANWFDIYMTSTVAAPATNAYAFYQYLRVAAGHTVVTMVGSLVAGASVPADAVVENFYGYMCANGTQSTKTWVGYHSAINEEAGKTKYQFWAAGNAPSLFNGPIQAAPGLVTSPSITFATDPDTGLFLSQANTVAVATAGVVRVRFRHDGSVYINTPAGANSRWSWMSTDGTVQNGTILSYSDTYALGTAFSLGPSSFSVAANAPMGVGTLNSNNLNLGTNGSTRAVISATGLMGVGNLNPAVRLDVTGDIQASATVRAGGGTAASPSLTFSLDLDTGIYRSAADQLSVSTAGIERFRVKPNGAVRYIPLAAAPDPAEAGDTYFDSTLKKLRVYDGTTWIDLH